MNPADWLLTPAERGNPATRLDSRHGPVGSAWTDGNDVRALVHGVTYFQRLHDVVADLSAGDVLCFTDWRGDPDEQLTDHPDSQVSQVLCHAANRGVVVKGLLWRSHLDTLRYSSGENRHLGSAVNDAGGEVLLDQRVRPFGSHHQKLVVVRGERIDVAFAGGIDLCRSRRDDARHEGDRQATPITPEYGDRPPWHDVHLEVHGPVVGDLDATFRERWEDPSPLDNRLRMAVEHRIDRDIDIEAGPLPPQRPDPAAAGSCTVQVLRTYPARRHGGYPFAPKGERSVAAAYRKVLRRARRLIYLEDQYLWSRSVAELFAEALVREPELRLVAVVPRFPDQAGPLWRPPSLVGRQEALDLVTSAGGDRVSVFDLVNAAGTPVYVHAKVCIVDDVWASVGSDNLNMRSWTHDSELSCAVLDNAYDRREPADPAGLGDGARRFARELRLQLWREHLGRPDAGAMVPDQPAPDADLLDPPGAVGVLQASSAALDAWYDGGQDGPRPNGHLREHRPDRVAAADRPWARLLYHLIVDPDGRPRSGLRKRW